MNLTKHQQQRTAKYLRDVELQLNTLPDKTRKPAMDRLRSRLQDELKQYVKSPPKDHELEAVLNSCGTPARVAAEILGKQGRSGCLALSATDACWLGVCGGLSEYFEAAPRTVRAFAVLFGALSGPFSLLLYLGAYAHLYLVTEDERVPRIQTGSLLKSVSGTLAALVAFYAGTAGLQAIILRVYAQFTGRTTASLGDWGWLHAHGFTLFFWLTLTAMPIAVLSALPVAGGWSATGKKVVRALLAVYAMGLSLGIAALLVGIILQVVKDHLV